MPTIELAPWQLLAKLQPYEQFALYGGIGTGKSFIGAEWSMDRLEERPDQRGFIGANTHQQLGQVALAEFFQALTRRRISYVVNCVPPPSWQPRLFENYKGVITVKTNPVTNVFTRVLMRGDLLRGMQFGWYWIDETRDTPEYTHDVVIGRMRGDKLWRRGLVTTSTNGKDWSWKRFVKGCKPGSYIYGSAHVPTTESVRYGIVSQGYLDSMLATYSALMAQQEIYAKHVNIRTGKAYHGWHEDCARRRSPWGDTHPDLSRPLIVGCDFNFSPAPCVWVVGQEGPEGYDGRIHWYGELAHTETGTESMTQILVQQYTPAFYYQVFGDASGERGSTSNAGETDYMQMAGVFEEMGVRGHSIDTDQANPFVKDRVESVNAMLTNGLGQHRMTYNPDTCPHLHDDFDVVGFGSNGKLQGDNEQHTHASDAVGYATYKLYGPNSQGVIEPGVRSADR